VAYSFGATCIACLLCNKRGLFAWVLYHCRVLSSYVRCFIWDLTISADTALLIAVVFCSLLLCCYSRMFYG